MGGVPRPDTAALLAAARVGFASRLLAKVDELGELASRGDWGEVRRAAHKLKGSASTYGFAEVGAIAGALEDALLADDGVGVTDAEGLGRLIAQVREQAIRAGAGPR